MAQPVKDPRLAKKLMDAFAIAEAGGDPNLVMKSASYKKYGMLEGHKGTIGRSFLQGIIGDPLEGVSQVTSTVANKLAHALGMDTSGNGMIGAGVGSDPEAAYFRVMPKISNERLDAAREAKGRGGVDISRAVGSLLTPLPGGPGNAVARAAYQGAAASALQPVLDPNQNLLAGKAAQATIGGVTGAGVGAALNRVARGAAVRPPAPVDPHSTRGVLEAANRLGLDRMGYGMASTTPSIRQLVNFSSKVPGGEVLQRNMDITQDQLGHIVEGAAHAMGGANGGARSMFEIGRAAQRGSNEFVRGFRRTADRLYANVDTHVPQDFTIMPMNTVQQMAGRARDFTNNPELGELLQNGRLRQFMNAMTDETGHVRPMTFSEAQALRTEIGRLMSGNELINGVTRRELGGVYGALSNDMTDALRHAGNTRGLNAFTRASTYWRAGRNRIDNVLEHIIGNNVAEEGAAKRIQSWVQSNSRNAVALRRSVPNEQWDEVASGIFRQLGEQHPGARLPDSEGFSINKFLTDFNVLRRNERAFNFAFGGTRYQHLAPIYRDLEIVAGAARRGAQVENKSKTGYYVGLGGLVGALFTHPTTALGIVGGNVAFANLMARPRFARWLLNAGRGAMAVRRGAGRGAQAALRAHVERLPAIAASNSDLEPAIVSLYSYLTGQNQDQGQK